MEMSQGFCTQCGATLMPGQRFCTSCGAVCDADMGFQPVPPVSAQVAVSSEAPSTIVPTAGVQKESLFGKLKKRFSGSAEQPAVQLFPQQPVQQVSPVLQPQVHQPTQLAYSASGVSACPSVEMLPDASNGFGVNDYATVYQPDCDVDDEATTVFEEPCTYVLVREATGEQLPLTFPAVLGKGSAATCLIAGNSTISRSHARLDLQVGQLMLEDMGSTNHTRLEGQELVPGVPVQLAFGQAFYLCDEMFSVQELFD